MESVQGTSNASKFASEDVISNMPKNVITHILDHLPIQDAVRTGILSRSWRFNWTMLSQLVFDEKLYKYLQRKGLKQLFYMRDLGRLLLHFRGFITKFVLYVPDREGSLIYDDINKDINHWIFLLSTKGITEFVLLNTPYTLLSTHLFSCLKLKHLKLHECWLHYVPWFHGFPNLLSLEFHNVIFESRICNEFITGCPLLEILKINNHNPNVSCHLNGDVKLVEMAKLENLKSVSLSLSSLGHKTITHSGFFQLLGFPSKLEELDLNLWRCKFITGARTRFSSTLPCLKTLQLYGIDFSSNFMVSCVWDLIKRSPNLQTLKMKVFHMSDDDVLPPPVGSLEVDCGIDGKLQLRTVELISIKGSEIDVWFIKSLLASSSLLEKMVIHKSYDGENYTFTRKLLKLHRASPIAEIDLN